MTLAQAVVCLLLQLKVWGEVYQTVIESTKGHLETKQGMSYDDIIKEQEQKAEEVSWNLVNCIRFLQTCWESP